MLTIEPVDLTARSHIRRFVDLPYRLYRGHAHWVPPLRMDIELDQGYPLTTAQDVALKQLAKDVNVTVQQAADRLMALRPKPKA